MLSRPAAMMVFIGLILSNHVFAQDLVISKLTGDFYVYTTFKMLDGSLFPSNSAYLVTDTGAVMFDTPWDTTQFRPLLDSIAIRHGKKVVLCIATHYHDDRTGGIGFLRAKGVKTYASKLTDELCADHIENRAEFCFIKDTVFTIGHVSFQTFYPGQGHTKDNIVIWFEKDKILYAGCLVKSTDSKGLGNIADANLDEWPMAVERVMKRFPNPKHIIPGHFSWTGRNSLEHTLKLLQENGVKVTTKKQEEEK